MNIYLKGGKTIVEKIVFDLGNAKDKLVYCGSKMAISFEISMNQK